MMKTLVLISIVGVSMLAYLQYRGAQREANIEMQLAKLATREKPPIEPRVEPIRVREPWTGSMTPTSAQTAPNSSAIADVEPAPSHIRSTDTGAVARKMSTYFTAEKRDSSWQQSAEQQLRAKVEAWATKLSADVETVECKSTMCRIELAVADRSKFQDYLGSFTNERPWNGALYTHIEPQSDGSIQVSSFITREGSDFPNLRD